MNTQPLLAERSVRDQVRETIRKLADYRGLRTDQALADVMGRKRSIVNAYKTGITSPNVEWLAEFGDAFGVPPHVLLMPTNQALAWTIEHAPNPEPLSIVGQERRRSARATEAVDPSTHTPRPTGEKDPVRRTAERRHLHVVRYEHAA